MNKREKIKELAQIAIDDDPFLPDVPYGSLWLLKAISYLTPHYSLMYLIAKEFKPDLMVEIGTEWGLGATYLSLGNPDGMVCTIDQSEEPRKILEAYSFFKDLGDIEIITGRSQEMSERFDDESIDLLYIDGDHRYEYEKQDYDLYFPKVKRGGLIIIDDMRSDPGAELVWEEIKEPKMEVSEVRPNKPDYFHSGRGKGFGIVFKE